MRQLVGCGYQGYEFGASRYPDSICVDGFLWDADNCDSKGSLYKPTEEIPCPMCNERGAIQYWAERNMLGGLAKKEAIDAARALVPTSGRIARTERSLGRPSIDESNGSLCAVAGVVRVAGD